jgi:hypothetical protein
MEGKPNGRRATPEPSFRPECKLFERWSNLSPCMSVSPTTVDQVSPTVMGIASSNVYCQNSPGRRDSLAERRANFSTGKRMAFMGAPSTLRAYPDL